MHRYFDNLGKVGIISDLPENDIPPNAWTSGLNVRFFDNRVVKIKGHTPVLDPPLYPPWHLRSLRKQDDVFWFYGSENDIGVTDGTTHATVSETSAGYSSVLDLGWTSAVLPGGSVVMNNGADSPQGWTGTQVADKFSEIPGWPANTSCRVIASISNFLVALDVTENGTRYPEMVWWSDRADLGSLPDNWDYADPASRSGRTTLGSQGTIVAADRLRGFLVVYQERGVWLMDEIGGNSVFSFRQIFDEIGALTYRCVGRMRNQHVVFSFDDLFLHDGNQIQSIANRRIRKDIFTTIDETNYERSYVAINYQANEVWFCYPGSGQDFATEAWVWNWVHDNWYKRELPESAHIYHGIINETTDQTFDQATATFDNEDGAFDQGVLSGAQIGILIPDTANTRLFEGERTERFDGNSFYAFVEKLGLPLGVDTEFDQNKIKYITEVLPDIEGTTGGRVDMYIGVRNRLEDSTQWKGPFRYTIGTTRKLNTRVSGRIIDIRFESTANITWTLTRFRVEYRLSGQR